MCAENALHYAVQQLREHKVNVTITNVSFRVLNFQLAQRLKLLGNLARHEQ